MEINPNVRYPDHTEDAIKLSSLQTGALNSCPDDVPTA
jgi:hypothetical protein